MTLINKIFEDSSCVVPSVIDNEKDEVVPKKTASDCTDVKLGAASHTDSSDSDDKIGFRVKPLNPSSIPRQGWTKGVPRKGGRRSAFEGDQKLKSEVSDDPKLQLTLLRKAKAKRKDEKLFDKDLKRTYRWKPQVGSSVESDLLMVSESLSVDLQNSCFLQIEPQVNWPSVSTSISMDEATSIAVGELLHLGGDVVGSVDKLTGILGDLHSTYTKDGGVNVEVTGKSLEKFSGVAVNMTEFMVLVTVVALVIVMKPKTPIEKGFVFVAISGLLLSKVSLGDLFKKCGLAGWFSRTQVEPQVGDLYGVEEVTTMITTFVNLYVSAHFGKELLDPKEFLRVTTMLSRSTPTVATMTRGIYLIVDLVTKGVSKLLGGDGFVKTGHVFIDKFFQDAKELIEQWESKELYNRASSVARVKEVISYGEDVILRLPSSGEFRNIHVMAQGTLMELKKVRTGLLQSNFKFAGCRHEPATLLLRGEPGVFKSQAMQHIGNAVNARTLTEEDYQRYKESPTATTYNRQFENVHWEGFTSDKKVIFFDDILQCKDVQGNPDNEAMNIIRVINIFEDILHMADIRDKGNTHCRPDFVIANTNMMTYNLESIHHQSAFTRRWDIVVDVHPRREFSVDPDVSGKNRKFDFDKIPRWTPEECIGREHLIGVTRTHPDMCEFVLQKLTADGRQFEEAASAPLSFEELVDKLVETFEIKQARYKGYLATLDDTLTRERAKFYKRVTPESGVGPSTSAGFIPQETSFEEAFVSMTSQSPFKVVIFPLETIIPEFEGNAFEIQLERPSALSSLGFGGVRCLRRTEGDLTNFTQFGYSESIGEIMNIIKGLVRTSANDEKFSELVFLVLSNFFFERGPLLSKGDDIVPFNLTDLVDLVFVCGMAFNVEGTFLSFEADFVTVQSAQSEEVSPIQLCIGSGVVTTHIIPQVGGLTMSELFTDSLDEEGPSTYVPVLSLGTERKLALDFIKFTDFPRYSMTMAVLQGCVMRAEVDGLIASADEFYDVFNSFSYRDVLVEKLDGSDVRDAEPLIEFIYDEWQKVKRKPLRKPDISLVGSTLKKAGDSASLFQKRLYEFYTQLLLGISAIGAEVGNYALKWAVNDEVTRKRIGASSAAFVSGVAAFKMAKGLISMVFSYFGDPQSNERSGRTHRSKKKVNIQRKVRMAAPQSLVTDNANLVNVMAFIASNNLFVLSRPEFVSEREGRENVRVHFGYALAVRGRCLLMPYHFASVIDSHHEAEELLDSDVISLRNPNNGALVFSLTVKDFRIGMLHWDKGCEQDIILIKMPLSYQPRRAIVKHFATEKQHEMYTNCDAALYIAGLQLLDSESGLKSIAPQIISVQATRDNDIVTGGFDEWHEYMVKHVYTYRAGTSSGDCGTPLFIDDKQKSSTLLGIHVAGVPSRRTGFSAMITRELLEEYLEFAGETYQVADLFEEHGVKLQPALGAPGIMQNLGRVSPECMIPGRNMTTSIRRSPLFEKVAPSPRAPAQLRPFEKDGVVVDPMDLALSGYSPQYVHIPPEDLEEARDSLFDMLNRNSESDVQRRIYNFEEAVLGDEPGSEFRSIPRGTSSGYPYNCIARPSNKTYFFGSSEEFDLSTPEAKALKDKVLWCIDQMRKGIRCNHIFTDSLKDERRSLKKVAEGKTRMFSGTPIVYYILIRMYFGAFTKWVIKNRIKNGIAIGVNEYSSEWELAARLLNMRGNGPNKGAGDFEGLDKREIPSCHIALGEGVNKWYGGTSEDNRIRDILLIDLYSSVHINRGVLMEWCGAMPSGHGLTACFNSLNVHLYMRLCWKWLISDKHHGSHNFNKNVYLLVLGDDNVWSVNPKYISVFNELTVSQAMVKLGQVYTAADKESELTDKLHYLNEVTFLKRNWRYDPRAGRHVAPLALDTVLDIVNWVKKGGNHFGDTETNVDVVLHELTLHGPKVFDLWVPKIVAAIKSVPGLRLPNSTSYTFLFQEVLKRDGPFWETRLENTDLVPLGYEEALPSLIYDVDGGNSPVIQPESGRFDGKEADLFRFTSRMAFGGQPPLYPGTRRATKGLAQPQSFTRAATNNNVIDKPGQESDGLFTQVQTTEGQSGADSGTTQSSNDAGVVVSKMNYTPISRELLNSARTNVTNEIRDFLKKPILVTSGTLATTDVANTTRKFSYMVPSGLVNVAGSIWANKVAGTLAFRGELHLTLQVNGNRFQQGRYILAWTPTGGGLYTQAYRNAHSATLTQVTQLPHVEIDVNCDTECTLVVPMINAQGWSIVNTTGTYGDVGEVFLTPYSPLVAPAGSNVANYSLFAHYENVEIAMPTVPQSGRAKVRVKRRVRTVEEDEQQSSGIGPLESLASKVSSAGAKLAGVPMLASVAGPVSWAADLAANVASAFGWSRPRNEAPAILMSKQIMYRMQNVDAADNSVKMGYSDKNVLENVPDFAGSGVDEMSLNYVGGISAFYNSVAWTSAQAVGAVLVNEQVSPRLYYRNTSQATRTVSHLTPLAFIGSFFSMWRGSIRITIKLVKTEFHSGRLLVAFQPGTDKNPLPAFSMQNSVFLHRTIVDVRMGNEFTIDIPYMAFSQYKSTYGPDMFIGNMIVAVLNPLVAPANVSSTVTLLFEASAGDDMEWAMPCQPSGQPVLQWTPQVGRSDCEIVATNIGGASDTEKDMSSRACIGERVVSFRSLLKRFCVIQTNTITQAPITDRYFNFVPSSISVSQLDSAPALVNNTYWPDTFDRVASCYCFFRGSMRWKFFNRDKSNDSHMLAWTVPRETGNFPWGVEKVSTGSGISGSVYVYSTNRTVAAFRGDATGGAELDFPFYSQFPVQCVSDTLTTGATVSATNPVQMQTNGVGIPRQFAAVQVLDTSATPQQWPLILRAMGEDASLGMFVSTLPHISYDYNVFG